MSPSHSPSPSLSPSQPEAYLLGVDLGTGGPKVVLTTARGEVIDWEGEKVELLLLPGGGAEQDPDAWWAAITRATQRLLARGTVPVERIAGLCISSQWGGLVAVDAQGRHLRNAIIWMDSRGAEFSQRLTGGRFTIPGTGYDVRALRRWLVKTGGAPTRTGKDPVGMTHWLRHHEPQVYEQSSYLLDVPEYLTMRLTGKAVAGHDTAMLRWCTDNRDPDGVHWDEPLAKRTGIDIGRLPRLVKPASVVGTLTRQAAADLGLPVSVQVVTGTSDSIAAAVGAGTVEDYATHLYIGTSAWVSCHVPFKRTDVLRNLASLPAAVPGRYWVATVQDVAGKAIDWLIHSIVYPDDEMRDAQPVPDDAIDRLNALAMTAPPGSNGVIFTPWLNGERTPVDDPYLRGGWFNVTLQTTRADLARAVFEGIALNVRWMKQAVDRFLARSGVPAPAELAFIGGGARSDLWCQTLADVLGCRIRQIADPVLANGRGAALYAAIGLGLLGWDEIAETAHAVRVYEPDPVRNEIYERQYQTFTRIYRRNRRLYAAHNRAPRDTTRGPRRWLRN
jgi:xylulokinase